MPETSVTLFVAALLFAVALVAWLLGRAINRRAGAVGASLRVLDERLMHETPVIATRMGVARTDLAAVDTATEKALWSLARFDERVDTTRVALAARRDSLDRDRERLVAAPAGIARTVRTARLAIKALGLRRAFLG